MFTGIIESEGTILELAKKGNDIALIISYDPKIFDDIRYGDSISENAFSVRLVELMVDETSI